ncbi:MAG: hypothetical protein ACJAWX_002654 [Algoriphagus sp.]
MEKLKITQMVGLFNLPSIFYLTLIDLIYEWIY